MLFRVTLYKNGPYYNGLCPLVISTWINTLMPLIHELGKVTKFTFETKNIFFGILLIRETNWRLSYRGLTKELLAIVGAREENKLSLWHPWRFPFYQLWLGLDYNQWKVIKCLYEQYIWLCYTEISPTLLLTPLHMSTAHIYSAHVQRHEQ